MSRVLVIDGDPLVRESIWQMLKSASHEAILAANGQEGTALCRGARPDLAIIDVFMPEQEGIEILAAFRREFPGLPVIAMSSGHITANSLLSTAEKMGAVRILEKPFSFEAFVNAVDEGLQVQLRCIEHGSQPQCTERDTESSSTADGRGF